MAAMNSAAPTRDYFCDISSLASDDQHANDDHTDIGSNQTILLYQRLERIEELTAHVLEERPHVLQAGHDAFAEIEPKCTQDFEIKLPSTFSTTDVVLLTILCIPDCMVDNEFWMDDSVRPPIRHHPLELTLTRKKINMQQQVSGGGGGGLSNSMCNTDKDIKLQVNPTLYNGEYSFVLTSAHGLGPSCTIVLSVRGEAKAIAEMGLLNHPLNLPHSSSHSHDAHFAGSPVQPIRVSYKAVAGVRAIPLASGKAVTGRVLMGESKFYRFVCQDRHKLVSIRVRPMPSHRGDESPSSTMGDPDVYVSNKHEGFVEVTRDNCVWRSTHVGADRIDIHPSDPNVALGSTFVIAVVGYRDSNDFEITATISDPPKIDFLVPSTSSLLKRELAVVREKYTYHGVKIDPRQRGEIVLAVTATSSTSSSSSSSSNAGARALLSRSAIVSAFDGGTTGSTAPSLQYTTTTQQLHNIANHRIDARFGRCVYTADELPTYAIDLTNLTGGNTGGNTGTTTTGGMTTTPLVALPDSMSRKTGVYPIIYASATCMYPSANDYTWRASGADGTAFLSIEMSEWKNTGGTMYFSIYGLPVDNTDTNVLATAAGGAGDTHESIQETSYMSSTRDHSHSIDTTSGGGGVSHLFHSARPPMVKETNPTTSFLLPSPPSSQSSSSSISCQMIFGVHDESTGLTDNALARFHLYRDVYRDVDGTGLSLRERSRLSIDDTNFSYGEIEYLSFQQLLVDAGAGDGQVLYDLGSGVGRAIVAAALSGIRFLRCVGIEALPALHDCAHDVIEEIQRCMSMRGMNTGNSMSSHQLVPNYTLPAGLPLMEARLGDMLTEDWSDADFVFATSVSYSEATMTQLLEVAAMRLRQGARLVTLSLPTHMHGMLAKFDAIMNGSKSSHTMTGKMDREGGERMFDEGDACFVMERTTWCKLTWGKVRAYVLIRTAVTAPLVEMLSCVPTDHHAGQ